MRIAERPRASSCHFHIAAGLLGGSLSSIPAEGLRRQYLSLRQGQIGNQCFLGPRFGHGLFRIYNAEDTLWLEFPTGGTTVVSAYAAFPFPGPRGR
ncbi:hypothetical protein NDU88_003320 [Pleurodeles waltl]|uniref:Uncharacterized protein n=1 Tax=Pleurodeles waltl TaxID=8319 RepID=A0AAV7LRS2_PLEWA|nr:hypothetical protein NDU88_003320 [Pleurodeles waltl]